MKFTNALGAAILFAAGAFGAASAQELQEVTISHTASLAGGIPRLAEAMGLFEAHGLRARLVQMDSANATATALISGSVDAAVSGPGELIAANARGVPMVVVANIYNGLNGSLVLSKATVEDLGVAPDAPVEERLKALDGLTIASTSSTSAFTVSPKAALDRAGASVGFVFMGQPAMQAALESGAVQGYMASAPFWTVPVLNDTGLVWISGPRGEFSPELSPASSVGVYMMRPRAEADPTLVERIAAVFDELSAAFRERPDEVKAGIAEAFPNIGPETIAAFYDAELGGFSGGKLTPEDMVHEVAYVKMGGANLPRIDDVDPATMLFP